jgi:hypothetical protein
MAPPAPASRPQLLGRAVPRGGRVPRPLCASSPTRIVAATARRSAGSSSQSVMST